MIAYADSRRLGQCRSCGAVIEWATNIETDHAIPFNPPIVLAQLLFDLEPTVIAIDLERTVTHFATCPQAEAWRARRAQHT